MQDVLLDYGDTRMRVELPDSAMVVRYGKTYTDPPAVDAVDATRKALAAPLRHAAATRSREAPARRSSSAFPTA